MSQVLVKWKNIGMILLYFLVGTANLVSVSFDHIHLDQSGLANLGENGCPEGV